MVQINGDICMQARKGVLLMLGACSDQGWEYLHAWSREGEFYSC